jgi:3-hydroxyacyl-CoA dehydrogenase/enoyl-CoA hydratase/3-hydroxybutyryl-CoA epimerase
VTAVSFDGPDAEGIARIVIDRPDDAVNAIDATLLGELGVAVRAVRASGARGLVIHSGKPRAFVAGADLKLIAQATRPEEVASASRQLQAVLDELAWLPCTTVAAINGAALGGGFELALACDYRIAADDKAVTVGQPEVQLGLLPAGGGTQRLPRLLGLERALDLILNGRRLNGRRARRMGLLDEVVHPAVLEHAARAWARKPKRPLDRPLELKPSLRTALDLAELTPAGRQLIYRKARQTVLERTHGHYPAPLKALEAVRAGFEEGMAACMDVESQAFGELATSDTARNLTWLFLATQRSRHTAHERAANAMGVVGAGFMGAAIAELGAVAGLQVRVKDVSSEAVARGLASVRRMLDQGVQRRRFERREANAILGRLSGGADYAGFAPADVVIEAAFEDLEVKRAIVRDLEAVLSERAVVASNTSAIPIGDIALGASHPERIVGMHFFSPAERMPLLEVIRPAHASDDAIDTVVTLGTRLGKTVIVVGDSPGFYTTRVLGVMLNEAALLVEQGARLEDVDRAMTDFGFPVGPFVLYDEVGLTVAQHAGEVVARAFGDRIPISTLVPELVAAQATGRKAGRGFYLWPAESSRLWPRKPRRVANPLAYRNAARKDVDQAEIQARLALLFVNEAVRCLDEGVLASPTDGDLGAVLGLGFPPFRGGPFHYADALGPALVERLQQLATRHGPRFSPADGITRGQRFFVEGAA